MAKIKMVCKTCGSDDVVRDAWAYWSTTVQDWVLENVFDFAYCKQCDGETNIIEKEITDEDNEPTGASAESGEVHADEAEPEHSVSHQVD